MNTPLDLHAWSRQNLHVWTHQSRAYIPASSTHRNRQADQDSNAQPRTLYTVSLTILLVWRHRILCPCLLNCTMCIQVTNTTLNANKKLSILSASSIRKVVCGHEKNARRTTLDVISFASGNLREWWADISVVTCLRGLFIGRERHTVPLIDLTSSHKHAQRQKFDCFRSIHCTAQAAKCPWYMSKAGPALLIRIRINIEYDINTNTILIRIRY